MHHWEESGVGVFRSIVNALLFFRSYPQLLFPLFLPVLLSFFSAFLPFNSLIILFPAILIAVVVLCWSVSWFLQSIPQRMLTYASARGAFITLPKTIIVFCLGVLIFFIISILGASLLTFIFPLLQILFLGDGAHPALAYFSAPSLVFFGLLFLTLFFGCTLLIFHWFLFAQKRENTVIEMLISGFRCLRPRVFIKILSMYFLIFLPAFLCIFALVFYQGFYDSSILFAQSKVQFFVDLLLKSLPMLFASAVFFLSLEYFYGGAHK